MVFVLLLAASCHGESGTQSQLRPAPVVPTMTPQPVVALVPIVKKVDKKKGDKQDDEWTPAEFKQGMARWKDCGVYVDGKPIGFLAFGELPITLQPKWVRDRVSANKRPGTEDPGWKWAYQRFYRFTDYLKAVGIDPGTVKEIHVYGPKMSQTLIATTKDLTSPLAEDFTFRFGANVSGKAIPHSPDGFGNGKAADKISSVMVYIQKKPPTLVRNEGLELDGQMQEGVPYYGDPIRGGVRIYLDDKLAGIIKRQELDVKKAIVDDAGEPHFKLTDVFAAQGVDTKKVVEAWVIRDERRAEKLPASALAGLTFTAGSQGHGGVILGDTKIKANAIALHTRKIADSELPKITESDD